MENHIRKIFLKKTDVKSHRWFIRYSIGTFEKESFNVKVSKLVTVSAGFEYTHVFHEFFAKHVADGEVVLSGVIEAAVDREKELNDLSVQYTVKRRYGKSGSKYEISNFPCSIDTYIKLIDVLYKDYILLSAQNVNGSIKVKGSTTPKLGSPTEKFVSMKLSPKFLNKFREEFLFDVDREFTSAVIRHTYIVDNIKADPKLIKTDPARARVEALRVGKVQRVVSLDGKEYKNYSFPLKA